MGENSRSEGFALPRSAIIPMSKRRGSEDVAADSRSSPREALQAAADEQLTTETQKYLVWRNSKDDIRGNSNNDLRNPSRVEPKSLS